MIQGRLAPRTDGKGALDSEEASLAKTSISALSSLQHCSQGILGWRCTSPAWRRRRAVSRCLSAVFSRDKNGLTVRCPSTATLLTARLQTSVTWLRLFVQCDFSLNFRSRLVAESRRNARALFLATRVRLASRTALRDIHPLLSDKAVHLCPAL